MFFKYDLMIYNIIFNIIYDIKSIMSNTKKRQRTDLDQKKKDICLFRDDNQNMTQVEIANF